MNKDNTIKTPVKAVKTEAQLKELKNKTGARCKHCGEVLDLSNIKMLKAEKAQVACTSCGGNNFLSRRLPAKPVESKPKVRMSKKDRKRARVVENGWANK